MENTDQLTELKNFLVSLVEELRGKPPSPYYDGALMVLGKQIIILDQIKQKREGVDMEKMKREIKAVIGRMGDIPARTREGFWPNKVKEEAERLSDAFEKWKRQKFPNDSERKANMPVVMFSVEDVKASQLANTVKNLRDRREVPENLKVKQSGNTISLVLED